MRDFFKKHTTVAILTAIAMDLFFYWITHKIISMLPFPYGTSNAAYFAREVFCKVLPSFIIAFCIGTIDSLKEPFKNLGNSLLSGALILLLAIFGTIVMASEVIKEYGGLKSADQIIFFILFVLMVGLSEELLMRGTITRLIAEKFGTEGKGMVISVALGAVVFGLYHLPNYFWNKNLEATLLQVLGTTMFGLLMCAIYVKWGNLLGMIILHAVFDFMSMSQYGLIAGRSIADKASGSTAGLEQTLISNSVFVIAAIIVMIHKKARSASSCISLVNY